MAFYHSKKDPKPLILEPDVIKGSNLQIPDSAHDLTYARSILQTCSQGSSGCVYDHLAEIIHRVIEERPENVMDYFEEYSRRVREDRVNTEETQFQETYIEPDQLESATKMVNLLLERDTKDIAPETEEELKSKPKETQVLYLIPYYNILGVSIPPEDAFNLSLSITKLEIDSTIASCRFWGKIFGLKKNYWILEVALTEDAAEERRLRSHETLIAVQNFNDSNTNNNNSKEKIVETIPRTSIASKPKSDTSQPTLIPTRPPIPPLPVLKYVPPQPTSTENVGSGVNRFIYFVANDPIGPWTELPLATPEHVIASRKIKKFFTGDLNEKVVSFIKFPGSEANLLRAMIARITHGGYVAPLNYWTTKKPRHWNEDESDEEEEEEEEEEEDVDSGSIINDTRNDKMVYRDPKYRPHSPKDLLDYSFWSHFRPFIQRHGRVTTYKASKKQNVVDGEENDDDEESVEEEEVEEEEIKVDNEKPEDVPLLFTTCSEDVGVDNNSTPAWTSQLVFKSHPDDSVVLMRSNVWPGLLAFASGKVADVIYVGWGHKYVSRSFTHPPLPDQQAEFPFGPDVIEINDPSVGEEEEYRKKLEIDQLAEDDDNEDDDGSSENDDEGSGIESEEN